MISKGYYPVKGIFFRKKEKPVCGSSWFLFFVFFFSGRSWTVR